jgi:autotransporter-associated beta strand protein
MNIHLIRSPAHRWLRDRTAVLLALAFAAVALGRDAHAANITWTGATNATWSEGANWVGGIAPANSTTTDTAVFDSATYTNQPNSTTARSIAGITIGANSTAAVTINTGNSGNRLAIGSGGITMASGAGSLTMGVEVNDGVLVNASQTWTNDSASALGWVSMATAGNLGAVTLTLTGTGSGGFSQLGNAISQGTNSTLAIVVDYSGAGTVSMIKSNNTFSGGLTIKQGTVLVNLSDPGAGTVTLGFNGGTANATLTSANAGTARSYASAFVLATGHTGALTIASTGAPNSSSYGATFTGGVTGTNNLIVDATSSGNQNSIQFTTSGLNFTGNLTKRGDKTAALGAANTFGGIALVEAGTLRLDHVNALQNATLDTGTSGAQAVTFSGTALTYTLGGLQGADALAITATNTISVGNNNSSTTYSGTISGAGGQLTKIGAGTLSLSGNNSYTGATTISGGTLQIGSGGTAGSIGSTSGVSVAAGATLAFNRTDSYGGNFTPAISGSGGLLLQGGALTLAAAQTYTGATTISGGTLALGSGGSFANSSRIVVGDTGSSGAALDLSAISSLSIGAGQTLQGIGTSLLGPSTALTVSGTFSPGNSPGLFTFDGGSTTLAGTTLLEIWGTARGTGYDAVNVIDSGLVTLGGTLVLDFNQNFSDAASFTLFDTLTSGSLAGGFTGITITGSNNDYTGLSFTQAGSVWTTGYNSNNQGLRLTQTASSVALDVIVVPEPGTIALTGLGIGLVGFAAWKRRRVGHD